MSVSNLSTSSQNYLKAIWAISEWRDEDITPSLLAKYTGVKPSTVTEAIKRLVHEQLVDHLPYSAITLTSRGKKAALEMIRRHRLLETYLVQELGYNWDEVHDEAEILEHACSDLMIERIATKLGHPQRDPHGDPIPSKNGNIKIPKAHPLTLSDSGKTVRIERISDADSNVLRYLSKLGMKIGDEYLIMEGAPFSESITAKKEGAEITLPAAVMRHIWVSQK